MVFEELLSAFERYGRLGDRQGLPRKRQDLDRLILAFYALGGGGVSAVDEFTLYMVQDSSQADLFDQVDAAIAVGLVRPEASLDHFRWSLTPQGRMYAETLMTELK